MNVSLNHVARAYPNMVPAMSEEDGVSLDHRLVIAVSLMAAGRPKYHEWHCNLCGRRVGDVEAGDFYAIGLSDVDDSSREASKPKLSVRCQNNSCRSVWYRFTLSK